MKATRTPRRNADAPSPPPLRTGRQESGTGRPLSWGAILILLTILAYARTFGAGFVRWDDQFYVEENRAVQSAGGLREIWDPRSRATQQYYPLTFSSFWLEHRLWGLDARGYHATNVFLHAANTGLVIGVARAAGLSPPLAVLAAGFFALHPAQVASVAWIAERKNTLSASLYLLSFWLWLHHRRRFSKRTYLACLGAFVAALLSKTQTLTLPASLLLFDWALQRSGRLPPCSVGTLLRKVAPMFLLGAGAALVTISFEQEAWTREASPLLRLLTATNAAAFYVANTLLPLWLSPIQPEWEIVPGDWRWWLAPLGWAAALAMFAATFRRLPPLVVAGALHFLVALSPILGLFSFNLQTYTMVGDHFLYLPLVGAGLLIAAAVQSRPAMAEEANQRFLQMLLIALLALGFTLTFRETGHWLNNQVFWERVRDQHPAGFLGHYNLGNHHRRIGDWAKAEESYEVAARLRPRADYVLRRHLEAVRRARGAAAAIEVCEGKLGGGRMDVVYRLELGISLEELGRGPEARREFERVRALAPAGSALRQEAAVRLSRMVSP